MQKTRYLFLIIYTLFSAEGFCQNLQLKVNGQTPTETQVLDSLNYLKNHKDYFSIKTELDSLQNTLYKLGYIENELKRIEKINDSIFESEIHLKNKFNTIYIYYNKNNIDKSLLKQVSKHVFDDYFILNISETENALHYINTEVSKNGLPFAKLNLSNIQKKDSKTLKGDLTIEASNKKRIINDIVIKGYEKFPKYYLKHFLKIKRSQVFDLQTIQEKTNQLQNLNFASETKSPEVLFSKDSTTLYLYIEKTKSNAFDGFLGFGTNEDTNKLEFDGYLNLNLVNNLNFGESFRLLYKSDENDQKTFETELSLPYLFKSPIGIDLQLRIFKKDSSFTTANQAAKVHYQINAKHKTYVGINSIESNNLLSENTSGFIEDYKTFNYTLAYQFLSTRTQNTLFPLNSKIYLETGFGERTTSESTEKQSLYTIDAFKIFNLNQKNSIYLRANGSSLVSNSYFENELLRFGGINSIRGFDENSLYATLYGVLNSEYRYQISNTIYVHTIIDTAYYENKITNINQNLIGYGFGFGLLTKAGLFKFNYANGKTEGSIAKLSNSKIHLSLIANF
ncbi:POTRA domain-containing protein [Tamlana sp. I1]|uniref:POTRA domain-containing protein n=1 Tax=Tamlana sp. I1 TaxID=2762061 RepID=UPI00188E4536|nr:POTRA domain-containing protein [Tamlana sp. I1]